MTGPSWVDQDPAQLLVDVETAVAAAQAARIGHDAILLKVAAGLTGRKNGLVERAAADQMLRGFVGACVTPAAEHEAAAQARRDAANSGPAATPWWKNHGR